MKETDKLFKMRPADTALIAVILLLVIYLFVAGARRSAGETAIVSLNGRVIQEIAMSTDGFTEIKGANGKLKLEVKGKRIRVAESECPMGICCRAGWINKAGEVIVCVPNKIAIEIKGGKNGEFDAVTY